MPKREYLISVAILITYIVFCCYFTNNKLEFTNISTSDIILKSNKPKEIPLARVEIDRLNINNYIYATDSEYNSIEKNVSILKESILPDHNNSIIFLAAHSGNSKISYFNNLNKIKMNDQINFYYNNYKYIYRIVDIREDEKNGYIGINKRNQKQLILTTCSSKNSKKQLIVDSVLAKIEKYQN